MIENEINANLFALRIIESAVHSPEGWSLQCGQVVVPANVTIEGHSVIISGRFPQLDESVALPRTIALLHEEELCHVREVTHLGHQGFEISWSWGISSQYVNA